MHSELRLCLHCLPAPLHISLSTLFSLDAPLPTLLPLSQVSDRPISAPVIVLGVLVWQPSRRWQEPVSAWELILPLILRPSPFRHTNRKMGREKATDRMREIKREKDDSHLHLPTPPPNHLPTCSLSSTKQSPWQYSPVTLPSACQRLSILDTEGLQQMDSTDWFVQGFAVS